MPTANLIIDESGQRARYIPLKGRTISIGREMDNNVRVTRDESVSRYHAVIERRGEEYWIADIGSANGTTVNGEPLTGRRLLRNQDVICLGKLSTLKFYLGDAKPDEEDEDFLKTKPGVTPLAPAPSDPDAPPAPPTGPLGEQKPAPFPLGAVLAILGVIAVGTTLGVLYAAGFIGSGGDDGTGPVVVNTPPPPVNHNAPQVDPTPAQTPQVVEMTPIPTPEGGGEIPDGGGGDMTADQAAVRGFATALASQITTGSGYEFDSNFVALISKYVPEFQADVGYYERAKNYRLAIELSYGSKGHPQLIPYFLAMSQTKFKEKGAGGVWFAGPPPQAVVSEVGGDTSDINSVALRHLSNRLLYFERRDFMYAIACYGMTDAETGEVRRALEAADPGRRERHNFWKMKNKNVVKGTQVDQVARFFAAGIVSENPNHFRLKDERLSSLVILN